MKDVLLIQPPFMNADCPSFFLSSLKRLLMQNGIQSSILYANIEFEKEIGKNTYNFLASSPFVYYDLIEFVFATFAFPALTDKHRLFEKKIQHLNENKYTTILNARSCVNNYLNTIEKKIRASMPRIICLKTRFREITSCIALANRIKKINSSIIIVMGGQSCYPPMGETITKIAASIDHVFSGEPEQQYKDFCTDIIIQNKKDNYEKIVNAPYVNNLETIPEPDFSDYYNQKNKFSKWRNIVSYESSRGCWWGEKKHCIFCGLHPDFIKYREKSELKIKKELHHLMHKYNPDSIVFEDKINRKKITSMLSNASDFQYAFCEVKPSLAFRELSELKNNGIHYCQPGIETFHDELLHILQKGTTVLNNIRFLRDCRSLNIKPVWNFLYKIPGEKEYHYTSIIQLLPSLLHLQPPMTIREIIIMRFSPLWTNYRTYFIEKPEPLESFKYIFPDSADLYNLSLFFSAVYKTAFCFNQQLEKVFLSKLQEWQNIWKKKKPELILKTEGNEKCIYDTRGIFNKTTKEVSDNHINLLLKCSKPISKRKLDNYILYKKYLQKCLIELLEWKCIINIGNNYVTIVTNV